MPFHQGRLIGHVHLRVSDLEASRRFSRAVLQALGRALTSEGPEHLSSDELWIDRADGPVSRVHLAFKARDRDSVQAPHAAALSHGGRDNGGSGERSCHAGSDAAFAFDPDGNDIEAMFHGPTERSAESVIAGPKR